MSDEMKQAVAGEQEAQAEAALCAQREEEAAAPPDEAGGEPDEEGISRAAFSRLLPGYG